MSNFWQEISTQSGSALGRKKPILCIAPMADVTDAAFRYIIAKYSKLPYITYTEFVSADGLVLASEEGKKKLLKNLEYKEIEKPIVAQIFGSNPENIEKVAKLIVGLGFNGLDINMGCPDRVVEKQGAGAALIKNSKLAREIITAAKIGIKEVTKKLNKEEIPVSVKTRLGYNKDELEEWLPELLAENPAAVIIHARTRKEMSKVSARWERIKKAVEIRDKIKSKTFIIGNGDILSVKDAIQKCKETTADGAMIGRSILGNPWFFSDHIPDLKERLGVLSEHIELFEKKLGDLKSFAIMKKHFKVYLKNPQLKKLRLQLMETEGYKEALDLISRYKLPN
ncbi:MAG: tRNA-dihydrouridine synthase family protein [Candidatus Zambryskibacteria bacterium]|nr:tRNA-dihydrouridine synthase family protein [Candidatus Zambryskibacteria bacterium]